MGDSLIKYIILLTFLASLGIFLTRMIQLLPIWKINNFLYGYFNYFAGETLIKIKAVIENNGFTDIRLNAFSIIYNDKIRHSLAITEINEKLKYIKIGDASINDIEHFNPKNYYQYISYKLKSKDEINVDIEFRTYEKIKGEKTRVILIIGIASPPFPFTIIPFLSKKLICKTKEAILEREENLKNLT